MHSLAESSLYLYGLPKLIVDFNYNFDKKLILAEVELGLTWT